jgi:hypothetical protein
VEEYFLPRMLQEVTGQVKSHISPPGNKPSPYGLTQLDFAIYNRVSKSNQTVNDISGN